MRAVLAPFFRASVDVSSADRRLLARATAASELEVRLRHAREVLRQNLRRLFAAALLAETTGAPLVFVEGWRSNTIARARPGRPRVVTGSWFFALWLRVLQRRGLVASRIPVVRRDVSRCTWEEARAIAAVADAWPDRPAVVGVSDVPCPSAARVRRYLREGDTVMTPAAALARLPRPLTPAQLGFWKAVQARGGERLLAPVLEAPNWMVHGVSEALRLATPSRGPLERHLAVALRRDRG